MALPEFQRGYVWNREQVRGLFESLYRRHPVGGLLVWATESKSAKHRGDGPLVSGVVKLLLDGQQRITSLYGVARGKSPDYFEGNVQTFTGLRFHLGSETFAFYQPIKMKDDPLWIDVTKLMQNGTQGLGESLSKLAEDSIFAPKLGDYVGRLTRLLGILDIDLHVEEVTGSDKTIEVVVDIFNRVNSGGTKLSKGDLALAKICSDWPEARETMNGHLSNWAASDYNFNLDWLLRSVNTVLTGEAKFLYLHDAAAEDVRNALSRTVKYIETCLNLIGGRLGLDHDQVFFGRFAVPVMVRYMDLKGMALTSKERDKLLFWYLQVGMWGRFSGSTESYIDQDLAALEEPAGSLDRLLEQFRLWHGGFRVEPEHFSGWSLSARFYPILYMLTRIRGALDWGTGVPLKASLLGKMSRLEVHHIFPKAQLYKRNYTRPEVNSLGNFCFLTKETNLTISDSLPENYFPGIEKAHPGALASQWIPADPELWKIKNFNEFLEARKILLANEVNEVLKELLPDDSGWLERGMPKSILHDVLGGIGSEEEEKELEDLNVWVEQQGLPRGTLSYEFVDPTSGSQKAVLDLAWPSGLQEELSEPAALLLNESKDLYVLASESGFRCFTAIGDFKTYVELEILAQ